MNDTPSYNTLPLIEIDFLILNSKLLMLDLSVLVQLRNSQRIYSKSDKLSRKAFNHYM